MEGPNKPKKYLDIPFEKKDVGAPGPSKDYVDVNINDSVDFDNMNKLIEKAANVQGVLIDPTKNQRDHASN